MAATAHLNTRQWSLDQVGQLQSGNRPGKTVAQEYHDREVLGQHDEYDHEAARKYGYRDAQHYQSALTQHVAEHGVKRPGLWEQGDEKLGDDPRTQVLANGYHRYAALRTLGHASMPMKEWDVSDIKASPEPVYRWEGPA